MIDIQLDNDVTSVGNGFWAPFRQVFGQWHLFKRLLIVTTLFLWQNGTGINSINYYSPTIFKSIGVVGLSTSLLTTGVFGVIKTLGALVWCFFIIDRYGRRGMLLVPSTLNQALLMPAPLPRYSPHWFRRRSHRHVSQSAASRDSFEQPLINLPLSGSRLLLTSRLPLLNFIPPPISLPVESLLWLSSTYGPSSTPCHGTEPLGSSVVKSSPEVFAKLHKCLLLLVTGSGTS